MKPRKIAQVIFLEELVRSLKEGHLLCDALKCLTGNEKFNTTQQTMISKIAGNVSRGTPLSSSLENHPEFITDDYIICNYNRKYCYRIIHASYWRSYP